MGNKERLKEARRQRKLKGLCVAGDNNPALPGRALCEKCCQDRRTATKQRKEANLCIAGCGAAVVLGVKCEDCKMRHLSSRFGLSMQDCILLTESKKCMVCGSNQQPLVIDHDHLTNKIRGLLCKQCNIALGAAKDNIDILSSLIEYLKNPPAPILLGKECFAKEKK